MNELPQDTTTPDKGARPTIALVSIIVLTAATLLCYLPLLLNHVAHSMAVLHPEASERFHTYATWDAAWNDALPPSKLDLRGQTEKDYDTVSSAGSAVGGFERPFSSGALQILEACPWCSKEEVREKADKWNDTCLLLSSLGLVIALFAGIFLDFLRRSPAYSPARSSLWIVGFVFSLIYIGNSFMCMATGWGVILPHWGVLAGSAIMVAFLTGSIILFLRMLKEEGR